MPGKKRRTRVGAIWVEVDVSDLSQRLQGISASNLMRHPRFVTLGTHVGLKAKTIAVNAVRSKLKSDPREAWQAVSLGYSSKKGAPMLFLGINDDWDVDRRPWNPVRKGTRGTRPVSRRTNEVNSYYGRSRAFILRFLNTGTQERKTNTRGKWNRARTSYKYKVYDEDIKVFARRGAIKKFKGFFIGPAKRALEQVSEEWLKETMSLVDDIMKK